MNSTVLHMRNQVSRVVKTGIIRLWVILLFYVLGIISVPIITAAATPKIGDEYGGGIVFYIDGTGQHGLVAAKADMTGNSLRKKEGFFNWYDAKNAANTFINGYSDWLLPNKEQLKQLYDHRSSVGGFEETIYWSSSESEQNSAWGQYFLNGEQLVGEKNHNGRVRAVRIF